LPAAEGFATGTATTAAAGSAADALAWEVAVEGRFGVALAAPDTRGDVAAAATAGFEAALGSVFAEVFPERRGDTTPTLAVGAVFVLALGTGVFWAARWAARFGLDGMRLER